MNMTVKELKEELSKYPDDMEILVYDSHFEHLEPLDDCSQQAGYNENYPNNVIFSFWAK